MSFICKTMIDGCVNGKQGVAAKTQTDREDGKALSLGRTPAIKLQWRYTINHGEMRYRVNFIFIIFNAANNKFHAC